MASQPTVFVVDDDVNLLAALQELLELDGLAVETYASAEAFLHAYQPDRLGCLVLDMRMRGMSGLALLEHLHARGDPLPVIILTGHADVAMTIRAMQAGAFDFLQKPVSDQVLLERIRAAFQVASDLQHRRQPLTCARREAEPPPATHSRPTVDPLTPALAELVGAFCHDLSNSLSVLMYYWTALDRGEGGAHGRASDRLRGHVRRATEHASETLRDLHEFVSSYYRQDTDLEHVYAENLKPALRKLLLPLIEDMRITLRISASGFPKEFAAPALLLRHLAVPLVRNAAEAIVRERPVRKQYFITTIVRPFVGADGFLVSVSDNGPGWEGHLRRIRAALHAGQRFSTKGTSRGRGLLNVRQIVRKLGGEVRLSETSRGGAKVQVLLPWRFAHAPKRPAKHSTA